MRHTPMRRFGTEPSVSSLRITHQSEGFPASTIPNGTGDILVTWDDILWAAVTVGRPDRHYVFQHGAPSRYEALFRWSLVRMALEQAGPAAYRLRRTSAARTLDPTEKGAVNYFLGMVFCKLFASKRLNTPWLLHLDVFRPMLNAVLAGRSRPDLVGQEHGTSRWHAFECKGRLSRPDSNVKGKAKSQALRLISVGGTPCNLHIGAITYFRNDTLQFYWRDPPPEDGKKLEVPFSPDAWGYYYAPIAQVLARAAGSHPSLVTEGARLPVEGLDLEIAVYPKVARLLLNNDWQGARRAAVEATDEMRKAGYQPDGVMVKGGPSWRERFKDPAIDGGWSPEGQA
jgi:hypothetical protein